MKGGGRGRENLCLGWQDRLAIFGGIINYAASSGGDLGDTVDDTINGLVSFVGATWDAVTGTAPRQTAPYD